MVKLGFLLLCGAIAASPVFAQGGNTAAGVAAGAALGAAAGQGGNSTASSAGSGGNAPIEIQIMTFDGMRKIATDIAGLTLKNPHVCKEAVNDLGSPLVTIEGKHVFTCAPVLIEDTTSAMQINLYQASQGYSDHLNGLYADLEKSLALLVTPQSLSFSVQSGGKFPPLAVTITNTGKDPLSVNGLTIAGSNKFGIDRSDCPLPLKRADSCVINVTFHPPDPGDTQIVLTATLNIPNPWGRSAQVVQLTGTVQAKTPPVPKPQPGNKPIKPSVVPGGTAGGGGATPPTTTSPTTSPTGSPSTTPLSMSFLSGISTAIGTLKGAMTYTPSNFQPTTQAFEVLIESEFKYAGIPSFTSTSAINLGKATNDLSTQFSNMLVMGSDVSNWANQCKLTNGNTTPPNGQAASQAPVLNPECSQPNVVVNLAAAQQLITAYTTLIQSSNDGSGNPVIVDVLRGMALSDLLSHGIISLQVAVSGAGGTTRSNSYPLVGLVYVFKPSYNAGVVATFELRDIDNSLLEVGARNVLFDYASYSKWKPGSFDPSDIKKDADQCGTFCSEK